MKQLPEDIIKKRAKKVVEAGLNVPLAHLTESIYLNEKIDELLNKSNDVVITNFPKEKEYPSSMEVTNLPEVQKVEITNLPKEKDDKEQITLLKEISQELKKKEDYAYDIEIDATLKEKLRGEKGEKGEPGKAGADGDKIEPQEIVDKLESLDGEERLDISAVRGTESLIEGIAKKIAKDEVKKVKKEYIGGGGGSSSSGGLSDSFETVSANLSAYDYTINYNGLGDVSSIVYSNGVTKTFNYTGSDITSIVLSGSTPNGIELTKTLTYTNGDVTNITYT